jgi:hypothetical protein
MGAGGMILKEITAYEKACNNIAKKFIKRYFGNNVDWEWIAEDIGGIIQVADYFFNPDRMITALRYKATEKQLFDYYDMQLEVGLNSKAFGKRTLFSFENYLKYPETFVIEFVEGGEGFNFKICT